LRAKLNHFGISVRCVKIAWFFALLLLDDNAQVGFNSATENQFNMAEYVLTATKTQARAVL
jgi:hypothetical protein